MTTAITADAPSRFAAMDYRDVLRHPQVIDLGAGWLAELDDKADPPPLTAQHRAYCRWALRLGLVPLPYADFEYLMDVFVLDVDDFIACVG